MESSSVVGVVNPKWSSIDPIVEKEYIDWNIKGRWICRHKESWGYVLAEAQPLIGGGVIGKFMPDFFNEDPRTGILVIFPDGIKYFTKEHSLSEIIKRIYRIES
jgi:hypothetical protein